MTSVSKVETVNATVNRTEKDYRVSLQRFRFREPIAKSRVEWLLNSTTSRLNSYSFGKLRNSYCPNKGVTTASVRFASTCLGAGVHR